MAITYSVRISGGGTDSFLGFEYCGLITLTSQEFRVLLADLPTSLRCLRIFGFVRVAWCCDPTFFCLPSRFTLVRPLSWVLGFCGVSPGCCCVGAACMDDYSAGSSASLAQCCRCGVFSPVSRFFALVGDFCSFLGIFASIPWLRLWCSLFCSVCLFSAYLYPTVASLVCFSCGPPISGGPCVYVWGFFLSVTAELCLLPLLVLGVQ